MTITYFLAALIAYLDYENSVSRANNIVCMAANFTAVQFKDTVRQVGSILEVINTTSRALGTEHNLKNARIATMSENCSALVSECEGIWSYDADGRQIYGSAPIDANLGRSAIDLARLKYPKAQHSISVSPAMRSRDTDKMASLLLPSTLSA